MSKSDAELLKASKINRVAINSDFQMTLYSDTHYFVVTVVTDRMGFSSSFNISAYENRPAYMSPARQIVTPPKTNVVSLAEYRVQHPPRPKR